MGGGNSTPKTVTMETDNVTGVVKVSESVARRLIGKPDMLDKPPHRMDATKSLMTDDKMEEIRHLEKYYKDRVENFKRQNDKLYSATKEEFARVVDDLEQKFRSYTCTPICHELEQKVMQCYQDNSKQTLNCSPVVKEFSDCVRKHREQLLMASGA
ncbi:hypothetical protein LSAT2_009156 [Lamellibrachia satsuma]|nr:hypothetical protein LSAT2_009156 [Lamellibrachia satsuma]